MTKENQAGGPAFPQSDILREDGAELVRTSYGGMTLRDYFAGQALAGIAAISGDGFSLSPEEEAAWAYQRADAMLVERNK